jgi:hypothetical protein
MFIIIRDGSLIQEKNFIRTSRKFSINLDDMIGMNYDKVLESIHKILAQWKSRKLTFIGKIAVIKTLVIPKMNHLILSLPNQSKEFIQKYKKKLFEFLWDGKKNKIKQNAIIQEYKDGGLRMIDLQ